MTARDRAALLKRLDFALGEVDGSPYVSLYLTRRQARLLRELVRESP